MAVKSVQLTDNTERKSLLAYQAYIFNKDYNGGEYNPDIYSGLYYSLKAVLGQNFNLFKGHNNAVRSIAFSPNSKVFYSAGSDGKILKWDLSDTSSNSSLVFSGSTIFQDISHSDDMKWLACASESKEILMIDLASGAKTNLIGHAGNVVSVDFSGDSKYLVSGGSDSTVMKWNVSSSEKTIVGKCGSAVKSVSVSRNDQYIAAATVSGEIVLWDFKTFSKKVLYTGTEAMNVVVFSNDGKTVAAGDKSGNIYMWNTSDKELITKYKGHSARINDMQFSSDDKLLASASSDNSAKIWQSNNLNIEPIILKDHESWVLSLAFSFDDKELVTACSGSDIKKWEIRARTMAQNLLSRLPRNMTQNEWNTYVGNDIPFKNTMDMKP